MAAETPSPRARRKQMIVGIVVGLIMGVVVSLFTGFWLWLAAGAAVGLAAGGFMRAPAE